MKKTLSVVGNSLALIIDRPLCRMLGVTRHSLLRVVCDGQRLIIEPTGERATRDERSRSVVPDTETQETSARNREAQERVLRAKQANLFERMFAVLGQQHLDRIHQPPMRITRFLGNLVAGDLEPLQPAMQRLQECKRRYDAGVSLDEALEGALKAFPLTTGGSL